MNKKVSVGLSINRLNSGKEKILVCNLLCDAGYYKDANNRAYKDSKRSVKKICTIHMFHLIQEK